MSRYFYFEDIVWKTNNKNLSSGAYCEAENVEDALDRLAEEQGGVIESVGKITEVIYKDGFIKYKDKLEYKEIKNG